MYSGMKDTSPNKIRRHECSIVNLDSENSSGIHWTAYMKCYLQKSWSTNIFDAMVALQIYRNLILIFNILIYLL